MKINPYLKKTFNLKSYPFIFIYSFITLILFNGCSVTGLIVGNKMKSKEYVQFQVPGYDLTKISFNNQITVILNNSDSIEGIYKKAGISPLEEYKYVYDERISKISKELELPRIGDTINFRLIQKYNFNQNDFLTQNSIFEGFDNNSIMINNPKDGLTKEYPLSNIISSQFYNDNINELIASRSIPTRRSITVETKNGNQNIGTYDIKYIKYKKPKTNALIGFLIGFGLDYLLVSTFKEGFSKW